tara:strand:+ start:1253 stop:1474 length:222 start_codon:yes stop_codon:yes gene_type:complete
MNIKFQKAKIHFELEKMMLAALKILDSSNVKEETLEGMLLQMALISQIKTIFQQSENKIKALIEQSMIAEEKN